MHQIASPSRPPSYNEQVSSAPTLRSAPIPLAISEMQESTEYLISALANLEDRLSAVLGPPRVSEENSKAGSAPVPQVSGVAMCIQAQVAHLQRLRAQVEFITNRLEV